MKEHKELPVGNDDEETKQFDILKTNEVSEEQEPTQKGTMNKNKKKKSKRKPNPNRKQAGWFMRIIAGILSFGAFGFLIGMIAISVFVTSTIATTQKITADTFNAQNSTVVLDAEDNVIYDLGAKLIENVEYEQVSQSLVDAFVSIEDSRFFEHNGFDIPRFSNALIDNAISSIANFNLTFDGGGASTIDMQLVKNVVFTHEDTITGESSLPEATGVGGIKRKVNEIYYATRINSDKILDKKVTFQKYINIINYGAGNNMLGVQKAAKYYFDKDVSELSLVESAFLAGVINAPNVYTPYYKLSLAKERTETVLQLMNFHGYITDDELERALTVPLENLFVEQSKSYGDALPNQAYIDLVLNEVEELTGLNPASNAMVIKTAMNPKLQAQYDRAQNREIAYLDIKSAYDSEMQLAATVIDNETGEIIASFGGYEYYGQRINNRSSDTLYQPGSTAKPLIAYAPAFEYLGYATSHVITDEPYVWAGTNKHLNNWDRRYHGQVPILTAINQSYNIPAVKTFDEVWHKIGKTKYADYAESIGFRKYEERLDSYFEAIGSNRKGRDEFNSQFSIGGSDFYTTTQELAGATAMIMNGGNYIKPHTIREVEILATGEVIQSPHKKIPVISDAAAYLTAYTMRNVVDANPYGGVERYLQRSYPVYAKTGTTNWGEEASDFNVPEGSAKDRLLLTATDRFTIASWSGFDSSYINKKDGKAYHSSALQNFQLQARLNSFTLDALQDEFGPGVAIKQPSSVKQITHILGTFPYQTPIEGMNKDLITTGFVKAEYANLVPATPPELEAFKGSEVQISQENHKTYINVKYKEYPDPEKLIKAPDTMEFELEGVKASGKRLYDPSWIFGPVRYTSQVYVNGEVVETVKTEEDTQLISLEATGTSEVEVCTFYSFELNDGVTSDKICHKVNMDELLVEVPNFRNQPLTEVHSYAQGYNINLTYSFDKAKGNIGDFLKVDKIEGLPEGRNVKLAELKNANWNAVVYDYSVGKLMYSFKTADGFKSELSPYITAHIKGEGNKRIKELQDEQGNTIDTFYLSDFYDVDGKTLYIITD